ncbi:MAG: LD-carboxypeptidase [candidate division KSB1 bacterium]|nr:LD-carboxypeptidase [candidate division KSB1 bacterium]
MKSLKRFCNRIQKPPRVQVGDLIGIVSPSGFLNDDRILRLESGIVRLQEMGFRVRTGRRLFDRKRYLAGEDADRVADLNEMLRDPTVKAVLCSRGGFGAGRILDAVDYKAVRQNPKIFIGFSDGTALQAAFYLRSQLVTFSGLMAVELAEASEDSLELWRTMLCRDTAGVVLESPTFRTVLGGVSEGILFGGCLSILVSLLGTPFMPDLSGTLLVLEDVGEPLYRIDRFLTQLRLSGALKGVSGVVFGTFVGEPAVSMEELAEVAYEHLSSTGIPIFCGLPYGHFPQRLTLPFGVRAKMDANRGTITLLESATV